MVDKPVRDKRVALALHANRVDPLDARLFNRHDAIKEIAVFHEGAEELGIFGAERFEQFRERVGQAAEAVKIVLAEPFAMAPRDPPRIRAQEGHFVALRKHLP